MQIIFGDHADKLRDRFTVLELDTFIFDGSDQTLTTWCVVESIPVTELPLIEIQQKMHNDLIQQYRKRNWNFCIQAIEKLQGRWNGELDSFYANLQERISQYIGQEPDETWTGFVEKTISGHQDSAAQADA